MKQNFLVRPVLFLLMILTLLALLATPPPQVHAATITVNSAADNLTASDGLCTLREAIRNANLALGGDTTGADCVAGSAGADTIIFNSTLDGIPITLSLAGAEDNALTGDLDIRGDLTINGNGSAQTIIDGGAIDRVFHLPLMTAVTATFNNITVQNGQITSTGSSSNGGGIMTNTGATLTINNSLITNNTLNVTGFTNSGGGIATSGILNINNSTISNNSALGGGNSGAGIATFSGTTTLVNSTISGNLAYGDGGGVHLVVTGAMNLTNVTITNNTADADFPVGLENGGGFEQSGPGTSSTFSNTIIAGNNDMGDNVKDDCHFSSGTVVTNGYNLRPLVTNGCSNTLNNANDITVVTLGLGPLQNNGGSTPTHALLTGSDAIDRIPTPVNGCTTPAPTVTDQRGVTRADGIATGTLCDVGAFEYVAPVSPGVGGGNGPGGVGTTDGSSSLELWLRSDRGAFSNMGCSTVTTSGGNVGCWQDQSGNGNNATESGTASPTYNTAVQNGQPSMRFDGVDDGFNLNPTLLPNGSSARTFVFATQANAGAAFQSTLSYGTNAAGQRINVTTTAAETAVAVELHTYGITSGTTNWQTAVIDIPSASTSDGWDFYRDGVQLGPEVTIAGSTQTVNTGTTDADLGRASFIASFYDGDIGETIVYSVELPSVQRILVDNYLSAKYDVGLGANDVYDGDTGANGEFDLDVAGIGQLGGNQHTQAYSVGMIVRNRSFLQDNGDWLLFGHRTAINGNVATELPTTGDWATAPDPRRWDRHWYVAVTDAAGTTGGTVDIVFDYSEGSMDGSGLPAGPLNNYRLLKRTLATGDFTDITAVSGATVLISGDQVQFLGVDVAQLGSNFTLGTLDFADSPTAVTVQNLTATNNMPTIILGVVLLLVLGSAGVLMRRRVGKGN